MEHPFLTEAYQKARRDYVIAAAVLFSYEFIPIELGGSADILGIEIQYRNPDAVQVLLLVFLSYFGYRTSIEWITCRLVEPAIPASVRLEFLFTHVMAALSAALYVYQRSEGARGALTEWILYRLNRVETFYALALFGAVAAATFCMVALDLGARYLIKYPSLREPDEGAPLDVENVIAFQRNTRIIYGLALLAFLAFFWDDRILIALAASVGAVTAWPSVHRTARRQLLLFGRVRSWLRRRLGLDD